ncbi:unnamed protein product [Microthlaspi erraticum]|uniref:Uncharacterized protein n=1 Tax=Microthlaspi erraticum TaxID=1685480 RepID=A0A6D2HIB1_9BRAS|nr:unnamed protein product [Microthlaspi erraticum]
MSNDKDNFNVSHLTAGLVKAVKNKLENLAGEHSDVLENVTPKIRRRVEVLREIQFLTAYTEMNSEQSWKTRPYMIEGRMKETSPSGDSVTTSLANFRPESVVKLTERKMFV